MRMIATEVEALLSSTKAAVTEVKADVSLLMLWEGCDASLRNGVRPCMGEAQVGHSVFVENILEDLHFT